MMSNQAMSYLLLERDRAMFEREFPALEVIETRLLDLGFALDSDHLAEQAARTYGKARRALRLAGVRSTRARQPTADRHTRAWAIHRGTQVD